MAPVRRPGLYVNLAVVLMFVFTTYLASSIRGEVRPSVSLVQVPTVSQAPTGIALAGNVEDDERYTDDVNKESQSEKQAGSPAVDTGDDERTRAERSGQEEYATQTAHISSSSVTASASASASAPAIASADASASASPASTVSASAPAAREQPGEEGMVATPPDGPSVHAPGGQDLRPDFQQNQVRSADSTRPDNISSTKVKISTEVKKAEYSTR